MSMALPGALASVSPQMLAAPHIENQLGIEITPSKLITNGGLCLQSFLQGYHPYAIQPHPINLI